MYIGFHVFDMVDAHDVLHAGWQRLTGLKPLTVEGLRVQSDGCAKGCKVRIAEADFDQVLIPCVLEQVVTPDEREAIRERVCRQVDVPVFHFHLTPCEVHRPPAGLRSRQGEWLLED